ncbi:MAG: hypothetical protein AAFY08_12310 [Planctomycetota bacterium]
MTTTTYGTWLPGDLRGYVDNGRVVQSDPLLESNAKRIMRAGAVYLTEVEQKTSFEALVAACDEFNYRLIAVSIESWHAHVLLSHGGDGVAKVAGRLKNRMRQAVGKGKVWTEGYDKRYCFTEAEVQARYEYIAGHDGYRPLCDR